MRRLALTLSILTALVASSNPAPAKEDAEAIVLEAFEAAKGHGRAARDYVFHERIEDRRFNRKGEEKKRSSKTWDVTLFEHSQYRELIAKNDRPLSASEAARERRRFDKHIRKTQTETARQREKRLAQIEKERREDEEFLEEITRAFDFRLVGEETLDGVACHVVVAEPRTGYVPRNRDARVLTKLRAKLWIARDDYGWARAEIETLGNFTWAAIFKLREGARVRIEQFRNADGVWLGESWHMRLRAKVAQVLRYDVELIGTYDNYRKFTTDTTETGWSLEP